MTKKFRIFSCLVLMSGCSCSFIDKFDPVPPSIKDAACPLIERNALEAAAAVRAHDLALYPSLAGINAAGAEQILQKWAADRGVAINIKPAGLPGILSHFGTTPPILGVFLPSDYAERSVERRSSLLWHELGHDIVHRRVGAKKSAAEYLVKLGNAIGIEAVLFEGQWTLYARWAQKSDAWVNMYKANRVDLIWENYGADRYTTKVCLRRTMNKIWDAAE